MALFYYPADYAEQLYDGPLWDPDPISKHIWQTGSLSPARRLRELQFHGRALNGGEMLSGVNPWNELPNDPSYNDQASTERYERQDDVYGSGIFDEAGDGPTVNPELGIFGDHPSIPGYIGREVQYRVSDEVADVNGRPVVIVPAGGLAYIERGGKQVLPTGGPVPPKPPWAASGPTAQTNPYAMTTGPVASTPSHPTVAGTVQAIQQVSRYVPSSGVTHVPTTQTVSRYVAFPGTAKPEAPTIGFRDMSATFTNRKTVQLGMGATETSSWVPYAFAGAIMGAAVAIFRNTTKLKASRR